MEEQQTWQLLNILKPDTEIKFALLVLNRPIENKDLFKHVWNKAAYRALADGATNHVYNIGPDSESYIPDLITGDFDSVAPEVLDHYKNKGVEIVATPDQDATDFTKCLTVILEKNCNKKLPCDIKNVIVYGAFGGRLDHVFANINTLYTAHTLAPTVHVYLMDDVNFTCLLQKGRHVLDVSSGLEGDSCGLVPIGEKSENITTTGLKWNLDYQCMMFGDLISTSNTWNGDPVVTVETDKPLLWTMNLAKFPLHQQ